MTTSGQDSPHVTAIDAHGAGAIDAPTSGA